MAPLLREQDGPAPLGAASQITGAGFSLDTPFLKGALLMY